MSLADSTTEYQEVPYQKFNQKTDIYIKNLEVRRWFVLITFFFWAVSNAMTWCTYSGIQNMSATYYNVSESDILWFTNSYLFSFLILSFYASYLMEKYFTACTIFGTFLNALGIWLRYFAGRNFMWALIGQTIAGITQSFFLQIPPFIADRWFPIKERFLSMSILIYGVYVGNGLGFIIPTIFLQEYSQSNFEQLLKYEAIMFTIPFALAVFTIKERPKFPPSMTSEDTKMTFLESVKYLLKNKQYILAMISFSLILSHSWTITAVLEHFVVPLNLSQIKIGLLGLVYSLSGMIGGIIGAIFIEKQENITKIFDKILKFLILLAFISLIVFSIFVAKASVEIQFVFQILIGFSVVGVLPFIFAALDELSYPAVENVSANAICWLANVICFASCMVSTMDVFGNYGSMVLVIITIPTLIHVLFFYKTIFKKTQQKQI